ncbi:MAG: DUF3037 domain-containing protein [Gammaproteobacteria bacterium]
MSKLTKYTFTTLRYVHDTASGEFVNAGVVLHAPDKKFLRAKMRHTYGRITQFFPGANGQHFRSVMNHVEKQIQKLSSDLNGLFPDSDLSAREFAARTLPHDDGALQWSPLGSGLTIDPAAELDSIFNRMVMRFEHSAQENRSEEDVWRTFSVELEKRSVLGRLTEKTIVTAVDTKTFQHAWKNGAWHCLEPVSFDLVNPESIRAKAHRYLGQFTALAEAPEPFQVYLLVGGPSHAGVSTPFENALKILTAAPVQTKLFRESQAGELSHLIAREMNEHDQEDAARS